MAPVTSSARSNAWAARRPVISTNVELRQDGLPYSGRRAPEDPGAAVYFELAGRPHVIACDRWRTVEENLRAIAKTIEATRGIERWGASTLEESFGGYAALPESAGGRHWTQELGVDLSASADEIRAAYKRRSMETHPDRGGSDEAFHATTQALNDALECNHTEGGRGEG